ncbi:hypothetical protein JG687_00001855, partial [Phytophthora cactorum]
MNKNLKLEKWSVPKRMTLHVPTDHRASACLLFLLMASESPRWSRRHNSSLSLSRHRQTRRSPR